MRRTTLSATALLLASTVSAHHSDAGLDLDVPVTLEGVVTEFAWRNPHIYFTLETADPNGDSIEWTVQMTSVAGATRLGWNSETLRPGDRVSVAAYPATNGRPYGKFHSISRLDGTAVVDSGVGGGPSGTPAGTAVAETIEGTWISNAATVARHPGRMDGLMSRQLELTERGRAVQTAHIENSGENAQLRCLTRPPPAAIVYTDLYPLEIDVDDEAQILTIRSGYFDSERTVYMDGRGHPEGQRFHEGHSIGHWEGDTLVVDSRNFTAYRSLQSGIPSGTEKHVIERYRLTPDGTRLAVEFMIEDPEFFVSPIAHSRELVYAPDAETPAFDCDPNSTTGFLGIQMENQE